MISLPLIKLHHAVVSCGVGSHGSDGTDPIVQVGKEIQEILVLKSVFVLFLRIVIRTASKLQPLGKQLRKSRKRLTVFLRRLAQSIDLQNNLLLV